MHCKICPCAVYLHLLNFYTNLKDWNIIERYEKPFSEFEENFDEWLLTKHGAIVNCSAVGAHTIPSRRRQLRSPSSSSNCVPSNCGRLLKDISTKNENIEKV